MLRRKCGLALRKESLRRFFVGFFRVVDLLSDKLQIFVGIFLQCPVKTGLIAHVALAGIDSHFENQAVLVAIDKYLLYFLAVAAFFAFLPQFPAGSAEICGVARFDCFIEGGLVHKSHHQHLPGPGILGDGGYQAVIVEFRDEFQIFFKVLFCTQLADSLSWDFSLRFPINENSFSVGWASPTNFQYGVPSWGLLTECTPYMPL